MCTLALLPSLTATRSITSCPCGDATAMLSGGFTIISPRSSNKSCAGVASLFFAPAATSASCLRLSCFWLASESAFHAASARPPRKSARKVRNTSSGSGRSARHAKSERTKISERRRTMLSAWLTRPLRSSLKASSVGASPSGKAPGFGSGIRRFDPCRPNQKSPMLKIFAGNSNRSLSEDVVTRLDVPLGRAQVGRFSDGEITVTIGENVRSSDVFGVQSTCTPANENLMELLVMIDALKRASAEYITAVIPYYGYARQDRKVAPRTPITAKLVADLLETAGATRVLSIDMHAGQIQGFFNIPFDHLYAMPVLLDHMRQGFDSSAVIISPDAGGVERARAYGKRLNASIGMIDKRRPQANEAKVMNVIGDVKNKDVIILDDMIDTAGTLTAAAMALKERGAQKIYAYASHAVFSGPAVERISESPIDRVVVTNTIPFSPEAQACKKITSVTVAPLLAEAIRRIHHGDSVSSLFV